MTGALPQSRVPDPRDAPSLRWGVLGPGWIAERFVTALQRHTRQRVAAVGSRSLDAAAAFAHRFGVDRAHDGYASLVADPAVDVVYVATPHHLHAAHGALAIRAGKHVLVEKPLALNAGEAQMLADLAGRQGVFCAEALWTLFLPKFDVLRQVLDAGLLGQLHTVLADHGEHFEPGHRIWRHELAGGPLLDLGTYPVSFAGWVLGPPDRVLAQGGWAPPPASGRAVNGQTAVLLGHPTDAQAVLHTTLLGATPTTATILGSDATLTVPGPFYRPGGFRVDFHDGRPPLVHTEDPAGFDGLAHEAADVARRITAGERQTPVRPLAESVATLAVLDEVRHQLGVVFDEEDPAPRRG